MNTSFSDFLTEYVFNDSYGNRTSKLTEVDPELFRPIYEAMDLFEKEKQMEQELAQIRLQQAYALGQFKDPNQLSLMGYSTFKDFQENFFPTINYHTLTKLCKAAKFLEMKDGKVRSILAKEITNDDGTQTVIDYDLAVLEQLQSLSKNELINAHMDGKITPKMSLSEIKEAKKNM